MFWRITLLNGRLSPGYMPWVGHLTPCHVLSATGYRYSQKKIGKIAAKNEIHTPSIILNPGSNTTSNHQPWIIDYPSHSYYPKAPIAARKKTKRIQELWNVAINAFFLAPSRFLMAFWLGKFGGPQFLIDVLFWENNAPAYEKLWSNSCNWKCVRWCA